MGRLGPLTSQALGRSPYDVVVQGTGEMDPSAPLQLYDERGRPVNHETKRINKDIIRSHNEVMQVIGVAEPDHPVVDPQVEKQRKQDEDENQIGQRLTTLGRNLRFVGFWGVNGLRMRNLLFREYSTIRFFDLYRHQRQNSSFSELFLAGLPSFAVGHMIKMYQQHQTWPRRPFWVTTGLDYIHLHLQAYIMMQRVGLISATQWFPHPAFFIPFTPHSPLPPLPPLSDISLPGIGQWLGTVAMNVAPALAFAGFQMLWVFVKREIWLKLYSKLPSPSRRSSSKTDPQHTIPPPPARSTSPAGRSPSQVQLASPGDQSQLPNTGDQAQPTSPNVQPRNGRDIARDDPTARLLESHPQAHQHIAEPQTPQNAPPAPPPDHPALGPFRRQSTFSTRGDEYVSEDEETELVNATLISFDVEATESADTNPPTVWSAELRPSTTALPAPIAGGDAERRYADNALTRVPLVIATDVLSLAATNVVVAPYEAFALRYFAGAIRGRQGLGVADIGPLRILESVGWTSVTTFLGIWFFHLMINLDCWSVMWALARLYRGCKPEWSFREVVKHNIDLLDPLDGID